LRNLDSSKSKRKPFKHKPMLYPVVIVLDNDDGLGEVVGMIKKNFGVSITLASTADYYHVIHNLYVIKTPETASKTCMESMFPNSVLNTKLKGKSFNPNKIDPTKEYGKEVFAKSVVKPNAAKIDFSGFDPLLDRIEKVLKVYSALHSP
jgi:RNA-directed DNA polymerase